MRFTLVADLADAMVQAQMAAAEDGHGCVVIMGGARVIGQAIELDLVDELHLHLSPILLGSGTPLFRLGTQCAYRRQDVRPSSNAVDLIYRRQSADS